MVNGVRPFFFFNDAATTEIYPLALHDALPISALVGKLPGRSAQRFLDLANSGEIRSAYQPAGSNNLEGLLFPRSEEHTPELQSRQYLVCRLLLEKKQGRVPVLAPLPRPGGAAD